MTYRGTIKDGYVILEPGVELPDGAEVEVLVAPKVSDVNEERKRLREALRTLPGETSFEDVVEDVYLLYKIERGVRQLDAGKGIPHEEARQRFREWLE